VNAGSPIAAIILSGGASRRMGTPKALLNFQGETFLDRLIRLFAAVADPVIVVAGEHAPQIRAGIARAGEVRWAVNPDPGRGMLSSLQCALRELPGTAEAVFFLPVDHPHIQPSTLEALIAQFAGARPPVAVPVYQGVHGHPVLISRAVAGELAALPVTALASDVIHRHVPETSYVEVQDPAVVRDVDDPAAYAELVADHPAGKT